MTQLGSPKLPAWRGLEDHRLASLHPLALPRPHVAKRGRRSAFTQQVGRAHGPLLGLECLGSFPRRRGAALTLGCTGRSEGRPGVPEGCMHHHTGDAGRGLRNSQSCQGRRRGAAQEPAGRADPWAGRPGFPSTWNPPLTSVYFQIFSTKAQTPFTPPPPLCLSLFSLRTA